MYRQIHPTEPKDVHQPQMEVEHFEFATGRDTAIWPRRNRQQPVNKNMRVQLCQGDNGVENSDVDGNDTTMVLDALGKLDDKDYLSETESESSSAEICFSLKEKVYPSLANREDEEEVEENILKLRPDGIEEKTEKEPKEIYRGHDEKTSHPGEDLNLHKEDCSELDITLVADANQAFPWYELRVYGI